MIASPRAGRARVISRASLAEPEGGLGLAMRDIVPPGVPASVRKMKIDKVLERLRPYGGKVLKTSVSEQDEKHIQKALTTESTDPDWGC